jgi:hypothetical protein
MVFQLHGGQINSTLCMPAAAIVNALLINSCQTISLKLFDVDILFAKGNLDSSCHVDSIGKSISFVI